VFEPAPRAPPGGFALSIGGAIESRAGGVLVNATRQSHRSHAGAWLWRVVFARASPARDSIDPPNGAFLRCVTDCARPPCSRPPHAGARSTHPTHAVHPALAGRRRGTPVGDPRGSQRVLWGGVPSFGSDPRWCPQLCACDESAAPLVRQIMGALGCASPHRGGNARRCTPGTPPATRYPVCVAWLA
jgi:hypothetical protein